MNRLTWYLRQLVPTTYRTRYRDADGRQWFAVWRMWMGRVFHDEHVAIEGGN